MTRSEPNPAGSAAAPHQAETVTRSLRAWTAGDGTALERAAPWVESALRRLAERHLSGERAEHTLEPAALANEVFLRLAAQRKVEWLDRGHFLAVAGIAMRRVLVDHARRRRRLKRGGACLLVPIAEAEGVPDSSTRWVALEALDAALRRLAEIDPERARLVELRFFSGLSVEEAAAVLGRSRATAIRQWRVTRAWLHQELIAP